MRDNSSRGNSKTKLSNNLKAMALPLLESAVWVRGDHYGRMEAEQSGSYRQGGVEGRPGK